MIAKPKKKKNKDITKLKSKLFSFYLIQRLKITFGNNKKTHKTYFEFFFHF